MGRTTSTSNSKERLSKGAIAKLAEAAGRKAGKAAGETAGRKVAGRTAARVASKAALDPDYTLDSEEDENEVEYVTESEQDDEYEEEETTKGFSLYGNSSSRNEDNDSNDDLSNDPRATDIFSFGTKLLGEGTPIRFQIKKNGMFLTTVRKPYSEDDLQKDHGEGHYTVILRHDAKGTFLKQQTFSIAAAKETHESVAKAKTEEKLDKMFETFGMMQERTQESTKEIFDRLLEEQRRRDEEEKERRLEERDTMRAQDQQNQTLLATVLQASLSKKDDGGNGVAMMQLMQQQAQQTNMMIMESNKNFMMMIQEMKKDTNMLFEKLADSTREQAKEFRHQLEIMATKKTDTGFDPVQMFKMLNDTREAGMNFGLKINELAKDLADSEAPSREPRGLTETIIDNLGKLAPLLMAGVNTGAVQNAPQYFEPQSAPVPQSSALVPAPQAPSYKRPVQQAPIAARPVVKAPVKANPVTKQPHTAVKPTVTTKTAVAANQEADKIGAEADLKTKVVEICIPLLGHALQNSISSDKLGAATINAFKHNGIVASDAVAVVGWAEFEKLAFVDHKLPDVPELRTYLKEYHDYLIQKATT